jgi:hypothetical protein
MTLITEAEAKKKLCPMMRHCSNEQSVIQDKDQPIYSHFNCVASECMAWTFVPQMHSRDVELWSRSKNQKVNSAWGDDAWWRPMGVDATKEPPEPVGFCSAVKSMGKPNG